MGAGLERWDAVGRAALARAEGWIASRESGQSDAARSKSARDILDGARRDADALAFTRRLLEALVEVRDPFTAALGLRALAQDLPDSLPARDRLAMRAGGIASLGMPWAVLPAARRRLRDRVSHLVLASRLPKLEADARNSSFRSALQNHASATANERLIALSGDAVLGPAGAKREAERLAALAKLPEVTHLAVDVARIAPKAAAARGEWALDADAESGAAILRSVLEIARDAGTTVVLEAHDYRSALLAPALLERALTGSVVGVRAGLRLAAELPESRDAAEAAIRISRERVAMGAEPLEVTLALTGLAAGEQISSVLSGHSVATLEPGESRAQLFRLLELCLTAGSALHTVIASEDPLILAAATLLGEGRSTAPPTLQLRAGTASVLSEALAEHGFTVRHRLPVVPPSEFSGMVGPLIHLAAEAADTDSPLSRAAAFAASRSPLDDAPGPAHGHPHEAWLISAASSLLEDLKGAGEPFPASHRVRLRGKEWDPSERDSTSFYLPPTATERFDTGGLTAAVLGLGRDATGQIIIEPHGGARPVPVISESGFANEPDTDAGLAANRGWARAQLRAAAALRAAPPEAHWAPIDSAERRESVLASADSVAEIWAGQSVSERASRVARLALGTASARDRLISTLAAESGASIGIIDTDVSGAVDAARYYGQLAPALGRVRGAVFESDRLILIVAGPASPLAERAEAMLAALAAGSVVIVATHPSVARSTVALVEEWQAAGLPAGAVTLAVAETLGSTGASPRDAAMQTELDPHTDLATALAADPRVDRAIVIGSRALARAIVRHRPSLKLDGRFPAPAATIVAPSADLAEAARGVVASAFGGGAADASVARALIVVGSAARSARFEALLADAVRGLRVGDSAAESSSTAGGSDADGAVDPLAIDIGPLAQAPTAAGLRALTELEGGQRWLVEPEQFDDVGRLWSPGVRLGVKRDSTFWVDSIGTPVLGVSTAASLNEAITLQNSLGGATAALFSSDAGEVLPWLDNAQAATLTVGRPTTGGRIERVPFGGNGASGMGTSPLAGGPNRLITLGSWKLREGTPSSTLHLRGLAPEVQTFIELTQSSLDYASFDRLRRAALGDALTWRTSLGRVHDSIGLGVEFNLLRHWPVGTHIRLAEGGSLLELARVLAAGLQVGAPMTVSAGRVLPAEVAQFLANQGIALALERDDSWLERIAVSGPGAGTERVRLVGGDANRTAEWLGGRDRVPLWAEPVTMAGPVELLAFLREQAISLTAHRHDLAAPPPGVEEWILTHDTPSPTT